MTYFTLVAQNFSTDTTIPAPVPGTSPLDGLFPGYFFLMVVLVLAIIGMVLVNLAENKAAWQWKAGSAFYVAAIGLGALTLTAILEAVFTLVIAALCLALIVGTIIVSDRK